MMTKYPWIRHGLVVAGLAALLAGCNGKEDFSDAVIGGDPLGSGVGAGANFQADDACAPRVVGALVGSGTVGNIGYLCDGFYGYTGKTGIPRETRQNFFVCPLGANSVTFFLGGRTARLELGEGYFRQASSLNTNGCAYDYDTNEYTSGVYDADGLYLFAVSDIVASPSRVDAVSSALTPQQIQVRNVSGLLEALDSTLGDNIISVDDAAHEAIFDTTSPFLFPDEFLAQEYVDFSDITGVAQEYLDEIVNRGGQVSSAGMPGLPSVIDALDRANKATAAGVYGFSIEQNELSAVLVQLGFYNNPVLFSDTLEDNIFRSAYTETDGSFTFDQKLLEATEYRPIMLVTRRGGAHLGGAFDMVDVQNDSGAGTFLCSLEFPEYVSLDGLNYTFGADGAFNDWGIVGKYDAGELSFSGRLLDGRAYNGDSISTASSEGDGYTDYSATYVDLPQEAYQLNQLTDRTSLNGNLCNQLVDDQPVLSFLRVGTVTPYPDQEVLDFLTQSGPMRYTLTYQARENASDETPDTALAPVMLDITIHSDGSVFTDIAPADGNTGYSGGSVPAGEFEIGMVSSVFRAPLDSPNDVQQAVLNLVVYNHAPITQSLLLPKYGSHFRARLQPDITDACDNRLSVATDSFEGADSPAYWFSSYGALEALRQFPGPTGLESRYNALRKQAYGYIEARKVGCP